MVLGNVSFNYTLYGLGVVRGKRDILRPLGSPLSMWGIIKLAFFVEGQEEQKKGKLDVV